MLISGKLLLVSISKWKVRRNCYKWKVSGEWILSSSQAVKFTRAE